MNQKTRTKMGRTATQVLLIALAAIVLTSLVWLIAATTKGKNDQFHYTFFAPTLTGQNYVDLYNKTDLFQHNLVNSIFLASTTVVVQLFFSSLAGFALAKYEFKGNRPLTILMLATFMIPGRLTMAPLFELLHRMGLVDSYLGLFIPGSVSVFGIFLFRQSILTIPDELLQAARIDGCSEFQIYRDIVMPVSRPIIGAFCLISCMGTWNSFLWPQIILHNRNLFTLPIALSQMIGVYNQEYGMLMAGTLISVLPVVILFLCCKKSSWRGSRPGLSKVRQSNSEVKYCRQVLLQRGKAQ